MVGLVPPAPPRLLTEFERHVRIPLVEGSTKDQTARVRLDTTSAWTAIEARDARFDGVVFFGVTTTGIFCRPSCPARRPLQRNVVLFPTPIAAQHAGFRACKRCHPHEITGPLPVERRDAIGPAVLDLVRAGVVDREGVAGVARRLGYSERQLQRRTLDALGATVVTLARAERVRRATELLAHTAHSITEVAFMAGFGSVRQCNDTITAHLGCSPSALRARGAAQGGANHLRLKLGFEPPLEVAGLLGHLVATATPGVEAFSGSTYRRTMATTRGTATIALTFAEDHVELLAELEDTGDLAEVIAACRHLLDLDADPEAITQHLCTDPALENAVLAHPGRRLPGCTSAAEMVLRAVLGQQVSTKAARTTAGRLAQALGNPTGRTDDLTHHFPTPAALAEAPDAVLRLPSSRSATLREVARLLASGALDLSAGADRDAARAKLLEVRGIGPWTVEVLALRGFGDPDVGLLGDLGVRQGAAALGLEPPTLAERSAAWSPWRSYAVQYLWAATAHDATTDPRRTP